MGKSESDNFHILFEKDKPPFFGKSAQRGIYIFSILTG